MPIYCFKCDCGNTDEVNRPMREALDPHECLCGELMHRDVLAEHSGSRHKPDLWRGFACSASGVHPSQVPEVMAIDKANGLNIEYTPGGDPNFTSRKQRKEYQKVHNLFDRDAGYGDQAPDNR